MRMFGQQNRSCIVFLTKVKYIRVSGVAAQAFQLEVMLTCCCDNGNRLLSYHHRRQMIMGQALGECH